jgi:transposase
VLHSGAHWRDLPERYGKHKTPHKRFSRWAKAGIWEKVFASLIKDRDNQYPMLDSTLVRAHQQAATDTLGRPLRFILEPGQTGDGLSAPALLKGFKVRAVLAGKAYDSNAFRQIVAATGAAAVIPSNRTRKPLIPHDPSIYTLRNPLRSPSPALAQIHPPCRSNVAAMFWMR